MLCSRTGLREALLWLTVATAQDVIPLEDGIPPLEDGIPQVKYSGWHDFKYLVPDGAQTPAFLTISGETIGRAMIVADTTLFKHNFRAFRWSSANSSTPTLRLTTDRQWASDEVHFIDCELPCHVYVSVGLWGDPGAARSDNSVEIVATSERNHPIPLVDGTAVNVRLVKEQMQVFTYDLALLKYDLGFGESGLYPNIIFTLSTSEGSVEMRVSTDKACPADLSTPWAQSTIILTADDGPYQAAIHRDKKLFVCTRSISEDTSAFVLVARRESEAVILKNGLEVTGAVEPFRHDRYRFFVSKDEVQNATEISVHITPVLGNPDIYISCQHDHPDSNHHDWGGSQVGTDVLYFSSMSKQFRPGWIYVSVTSSKAASYSLRAEWGSQNVILRDGAEEIGHCMKNDVRPFVLEVSERQKNDSPVVIRAQAWMGAFSLCVTNLDAEDDSSVLTEMNKANRGESLDCLFKASADSDRQAEAGSGVAAIDIPAQTLQKGARLALLVQGLKYNNAFAIRGLVEARMILAEGHDLVDALGPTCCVKGDVWQQLLIRRYRTFVKPEPGATIKVHSLGDGSLVGATLKARRMPMQVSSDDDVEHDATPWSFETDAPEGSLTTDTLTLLADLSFFDRDFWLEIKLSVTRPVNYTLSITTKGTHKVQDAQKQLQPGVKENVRATDVKLFQFPLDPLAGDGDWELEVRQCYGRVAVKLPYCLDCSELVANGTDVNLPLPTHGLKRSSGSINAAGSARIQPTTASPVIYEMTLKSAGASEDETPIFFKDKPLLKRPLWGKLTFDFSSAAINNTRLRSLLPEPDKEAALYYKLVAIPVNNTLLNANTSCGIEEAIRRKEAVMINLQQSETVYRKRLSGTFSQLSEADYMINVLVSLKNEQGKVLARRCYEPFHLDMRAQAVSPPVQSRMLGGLLAILLMVAVCYFTTRERNSVSRGFAMKEAIEMEDPYELHQSDFECPGKRKRGGYVPPGFS